MQITKSSHKKSFARSPQQSFCEATWAWERCGVEVRSRKLLAFSINPSSRLSGDNLQIKLEELGQKLIFVQFHWKSQLCAHKKVLSCLRLPHEFSLFLKCNFIFFFSRAISWICIGNHEREFIDWAVIDSFNVLCLLARFHC